MHLKIAPQLQGVAPQVLKWGSVLHLKKQLNIPGLPTWPLLNWSKSHFARLGIICLSAVNRFRCLVLVYQPGASPYTLRKVTECYEFKPMHISKIHIIWLFVLTMCILFSQSWCYNNVRFSRVCNVSCKGGVANAPTRWTWWSAFSTINSSEMQ